MAARVIGITGGMAAGKTTLAQKMQAETGAAFIAVDDVRRAVGGSDADHFDTLWDRIKDRVRDAVETRVRAESGPVILEWARLIEDGFLDLTDEVVLVHCDEALRLERLAGGDLTEAQILKRLDRQMTTEQMRAALDRSGKPYRLVDTGDAYDPAASFCLFRIPRKGGRVIWEVTNSCNYGCRYCIFSSTSRKHADELDTARALQTLEELKSCGFTHLKITGGEPFTRPDLMDILRRARALGLHTDISTNAAYITQDVACDLAALGLDMVHVSLDGHTPYLQETIRGKRTYASTMEGLRHLSGKGIYIRIGCVLYQDNQNALKDITEFCAEQGFNEIIFSLMEPVGRMKGRPALLCTRNVQDIKEDIAALNAAYGDRIKVSGNFAEAIREGCGTCPGGARFLFIDHKGRVSPCTWVAERAPAYIGQKTLHTHTLSDILNDRETKSFRKIVTDLSQSGLDRCPMQIVPEFSEAEEIDTLLTGDLKDNLARRGRHGTYSPVYAHATENIGGFLPLFNLHGKSVLTVGGSGDQMICAYAAGALHVENFDINRLAHYVAELKLILLQRLPFEDFRSFWQDFPIDIYRAHRMDLPLPARYFFDQAYARFSQDGTAFRNSPLFRILPPRFAANIPYLKDEGAYQAAQAACVGRPAAWTTCPASDAARHHPGPYDVILLSNIADYAHLTYNGDYLAAFRRDIADPLAVRLSPGGRMMLAYVYDALDRHSSSTRSLINDPKARKAAFSRYEDGTYSETAIPSAWEADNRDTILTWEKHK